MSGLPSSVSDLDWQDRAACDGMDPDIFFPGVGESLEPARRICAQCPVSTECLAYALAVPERESVGVWAGTSERQRRDIRRARNRAARELIAPTERWRTDDMQGARFAS